MPAIGDGHALLKWVTSFPGNPARGLPTVTGLVLLSDAEDGRLLAVLDAAAVTGAAGRRRPVCSPRTRSAAPEASSYAVIGCGVNGAETARMLLAHGVTPLVWDVDEQRRRGRSPSASARATAASARRGARLRGGHHGDARRRGPLSGGSLEAGQHVSLMGADGPGRPRSRSRSSRRAHVFCDDWEQASHGGELGGGRATAGARHARPSPSSARVLVRRGRRPAQRGRHHVVRLDRPRDPGSRDREGRVREGGRVWTCRQLEL